MASVTSADGAHPRPFSLRQSGSARVADEDEGGPVVRVDEGAIARRRRQGVALLDNLLAPRQRLGQLADFGQGLLSRQLAQPGLRLAQRLGLGQRLLTGAGAEQVLVES